MSAAPASRDSRSALRSTGVVGASLLAWSIGSYVFYLVAGRLLGPDDYGLVAALQGVIVVLAMPCTALQWSMARTIASRAQADRDQALAVYRRALLSGTLIAIGLALIATATTVALHAAHPGIPMWALISTYATAIPLIPLMLTIGALQGEHRYGGYAVSYGATGVLRAPLLVGLLVLPIGGVEATLLATGAAYVVGVLWAAWLTRDDLRRSAPPSAEAWRGFTHSLPATAVGLAGLASLINLDVVAAKLGLGGDEAGYFGAASILAKAMILVPQALTIILLPRVAEREKHGQPTGPLLAAGVSITVVAGALAMGVAFLIEDPVMTLTFGSAYAPGAALVAPFIGATTLLGALLVLVNHHVARSDHRFVWMVGSLAIVHVVLLVLMSGSAYGIIAADAITAGLGLVVHEIVYWKTDECMVRGVARQFSTLRRRSSRVRPGPS